MKLIIDINDNEYIGIKEYPNNITSYPVTIHIYDNIRHGVPLEDMIDKIRAEILDEAEYAYADFERYKVDYLGADAEYVEDELPQDDFRYGMERAIEIIDKYKVESEVQE